MKKFSVEIFSKNIRDIVFPNYLTDTYVYDAYSDFIFVEAINFMAPAKLIRVKANPTQNLGLTTKLCQQ